MNNEANIKRAGLFEDVAELRNLLMEIKNVVKTPMLEQADPMLPGSENKLDNLRTEIQGCIGIAQNINESLVLLQ